MSKNDQTFKERFHDWVIYVLVALMIFALFFA